MKKFFFFLLVLAVAFGVYWFFIREKKASVEEPKVAPLAVKQHSAAFNNKIDSLMDAYFVVKNAFVETDSVAAKAAVQKLITLADTATIEELKKDTSGIYSSAVMEMNDIKMNAESLLKQTDITEMRQDFRMISENIYPFLKTIGYEGKTLYWQNCPMAFGEDKGANWISNTEEVVNPYLGKKHPEFKATMLHCGEVKDSIKAH